MALETNFKILLFKNRNYTIFPHEDGLLPNSELIMQEQVYLLFVTITCLFINTEEPNYKSTLLQDDQVSDY